MIGRSVCGWWELPGGGLPSRSLKLLPMLGVPSLPSLEYPLRFSSAVLRGDSGPEGFLRLPGDGLDMYAAEFSDESEFDDFWSMRSFSLPLPLPFPWLLGSGPVTFCNRLAALEAKSRGSPRNVALGSVY